ncbi:MAG: hypothetical protein BGO82_05510 [Devosia sp. 67-54]|uniref:hypothetical protein n=1 Tax=unclassified Devosia TaxID=196773 RepID=UPI0009616F57|nr:MULTISPECIES: hypothetical protein [unclassified Devosia]MBN9306926.1 hypothetical protein [Devosia sp.]OJX16977.1 MAG: hypothetical protein BGO82_05510 [Devosia sp. 67-54]
MKIAILGWGSLLWDSRKDFDGQHEQWSEAGPLLPLEFSRISESRKGALTLVIDEQHGMPCATSFAISKRADPDDAICDLRCREGTTLKNIGVFFADGSRPARGASKETLAAIEAVAKLEKIDVITWTALTSNFNKKTGRPFSVAGAVAYLKALPGEARLLADEYVRRAPGAVQTPLRAALAADPIVVAREENRQDLLPRSFQADIMRFFDRAARPLLTDMTPHVGIKTGEKATIDEFLDDARKLTDNRVAFETRRILALSLVAIFERQLRIWGRVHIDDLPADRVSAMPLDQLLDILVALRHIEIEPKAVDTLKEMVLVGNVTRHGDGRSIDELRKAAPALWTSGDAEAERASYTLSEKLEIRDEDFQRYMNAAVAFWGWADREPFAVRAGPYR